MDSCELSIALCSSHAYMHEYTHTGLECQVTVNDKFVGDVVQSNWRKQREREFNRISNELWSHMVRARVCSTGATTRGLSVWSYQYNLPSDSIPVRIKFDCASCDRVTQSTLDNSPIQFVYIFCLWFLSRQIDIYLPGAKLWMNFFSVVVVFSSSLSLSLSVGSSESLSPYSTAMRSTARICRLRK